MKKISLSIGMLFALFFCGSLIKWTSVELFYPEPTIMQSYISPDGKYTAYVYESNGGATSGWTYHISIIQSEKKLGKGNGNVYISDIPPVKLTWLDNNTLYVDDYDSVGTTKRKEKIHNITVKFKSLEKIR